MASAAPPAVSAFPRAPAPARPGRAAGHRPGRAGPRGAAGAAHGGGAARPGTIRCGAIAAGHSPVQPGTERSSAQLSPAPPNAAPAAARPLLPSPQRGRSSAPRGSVTDWLRRRAGPGGSSGGRRARAAAALAAGGMRGPARGRYVTAGDARPARPGPSGSALREGRPVFPITALRYRPRGLARSRAAGAPSLSLLAVERLWRRKPRLREGRRAPCPGAGERRRRALSRFGAGEPGAVADLGQSPPARCCNGLGFKKGRLNHPLLAPSPCSPCGN